MISLCNECHVGEHGVHPDTHEARVEYLNMSKKRGEKLADREIYWDDSHDRQLQVRAVRNTQQARIEGDWEWQWDVTQP